MLYDLDAHVAELYDQIMTEAEDIVLIQGLIGSRKRLRILEPFCGTGRMLIPLALNGHHVVGMDRAQGMLARAQTRVRALPAEAQERVTLLPTDVLREEWPLGFDLVILGSNCLYELATSAEQSHTWRGNWTAHGTIHRCVKMSFPPANAPTARALRADGRSSSTTRPGG